MPATCSATPSRSVPTATRWPWAPSTKTAPTRQINGPPDNRTNGAGAAYVFTRAGTSWSQQAYIKPSNGESQDSFGVDVALERRRRHAARRLARRRLHGHRRQRRGLRQRLARRPVDGRGVRVRAQRDDAGRSRRSSRPRTPGPTTGSGRGSRSSGDGSIAAIGASLEDGAAQGRQRAAGRRRRERGRRGLLVHPQPVLRGGSRRTSRGPTPKPSTSSADRWRSIASGSLLVVAAPGEDSGAAPANPADNSAEAAGAVYVFALTR